MQESDATAWYRRWTWKKLIVRSLLLTFVLLAAAAGWVHWKLRSSLPQIAGTVNVSGIADSVTIDRDHLGVPSIKATSRNDAAFGLGFLHAQDRFFQMDCLRRLSAGRLSELFGEAAVDSDMRFRKHRFSERASKVMDGMPAHYRSVLDAYTSGVNQGIELLHAAPFEYLMLGQQPREWEAQDTILVMLSMLCDLQPMDAKPELALGLLHEKIPAEVFDFLVPRGSQWDAALDDSMFEPAAIPSAEIWSMRSSSALEPQEVAHDQLDDDVFGLIQISSFDREFRVGSNNFVVSPARGNGHAMLGSDMHLGLRIPATWYRAVITSPTIAGDERTLVGVTLPGTPMLVEGSNGSVAWGFTNSYGDYSDVIELKTVSNQPDHYLTPDGPKPLVRHTESITFKGGSKEFEYLWSEWGPVVAERDGRRFVHRWVGHDSEAFNLRAMELEATSSVEETLLVANSTGMPHVNIVAVDTSGNIGWTVCGRVPRRRSEPPMLPVDWSTTEMDWQGYLSPDEYPRLLNPPDGIIWTANNRILGDEYLRLIGDGGYDRGARARQIRDRLRAEKTFDEKSLMQVQLDDEALFLQRWQTLLLTTCQAPTSPVSEEFIEHVIHWEGRASTTSVGYRLTHEFRQQVINRIFGFEVSGREALNSAISEPGGFAVATGIREYVPIAYEDASWSLITEQPEHWLALKYNNWQELLEEAASATERTLTREHPLTSATWGQRNLVTVNHPITGVVPILSSWLNMPPCELPGDNNMPRVQGPLFGASQRMVVAPGRETEGIYHQPGGQSAHPYSPFYQAGFEDWYKGNPSPLLPGKTLHTLVLEVSTAQAAE